VFEFGTPLWLVLLPLPPLLWWLWARRPARGDVGALLHPLACTIGELQRTQHSGRTTVLLWLCSCSLLILALAQPQWRDEDAAANMPGYDLVFAVDVSGSMRALDYTVDDQPLSRLDMVKQALAHFFERAHGLRAALLVFADQAYTLMPLTADLGLAAEMSQEIDHGYAGERTALGDAVLLATRRVESSSLGARILVLLSDGENTAGDISPEAAATLAREQGLRIYTVGIGQEGAVPFPLGNGNIIYRTLPLDEGTLKQLAAATDGDYLRLHSAQDLDALLDRIHRIEKARIPVPAPVHEWYWIAALLSLVFLLLAELRRNNRLVTI
jgi:Ca-activated chloride channel family protein